MPICIQEAPIPPYAQGLLRGNEGSFGKQIGMTIDPLRVTDREPFRFGQTALQAFAGMRSLFGAAGATDRTSTRDR